ncbi:carbon monoxide dehydrogenase subunit G [Streptomyces canus]|nr:carbon monoxide dehydrogenase subunit G [Streptomyces canus]
MPGATVQDYDGKTVNGSVRVKVGPITVTYQGTAVFEEQDEDARRIVLIASGRETRGQGTARATVTGTLTEQDGGTAVSVRTDLTVTGRPAQFGRGVMAEVGDRIIGRFTQNLAEQLGDEPQETPPVADEPLDLFRTAGVPVAKRAAAAAAAVVVALVVVLRRWRRR